MEKLRYVILFALFFALSSFLFTYPVMWLANYLFSSTFLTFVFGVSSLPFWKAWTLLFLTGMLFKNPSSKSN